MPVLSGAASAEVYVVAPGPEGQDVSYYSFIQTLNRGQYPTLYAHVSYDDNGFDHNAETFVRFDLPAGMLAEGETVLYAAVVMVFAFTFDHGGNPPPPDGELSLSVIAEEWQEDALNFQTQPLTTEILETKQGIDAFGPVGFDVTEHVALWAHGMAPNYGFKFSNQFAAPMGFHSFESPVDPALKARLLMLTGPGDPPQATPEPGLIPAGGLGLVLLGVLHRARLRRGRRSR